MKLYIISCLLLVLPLLTCAELQHRRHGERYRDYGRRGHGHHGHHGRDSGRFDSGRRDSDRRDRGRGDWYGHHEDHHNDTRGQHHRDSPGDRDRGRGDWYGHHEDHHNDTRGQHHRDSPGDRGYGYGRHGSLHHSDRRLSGLWDRILDAERPARLAGSRPSTNRRQEVPEVSLSDQPRENPWKVLEGPEWEADNPRKQSEGDGDRDGTREEQDREEDDDDGFGEYPDPIDSDEDDDDDGFGEYPDPVDSDERDDDSDEDEDEDGKKKIDIFNIFGKDVPDWDWDVEVDLPAWIRHLFQGSVTIGDPGFGASWDVGSLFDELDEEWWNGPNVCRTKDVSELRDREDGEDRQDISRHHAYSSTHCDQTPTAYRCITKMGFLGKEKSITTISECCHGYQREPGLSGCTKELVLEDVLQTVKELGVTEIGKALAAVGWTDSLQTANYTVFAPTNAALEHYLSKKRVPADGGAGGDGSVVIVSPELVEAAENMQAVFSAHIMPGFVRTSLLHDEQLLPTEHPEAQIRVNMYDVPKRLVTANCVPVTSPDNMATNGVVHIVDKVLSPVTGSLLHKLENTRHLLWFSMAVEKSSLTALLKKPGQYTLFAPSDEAFNRLDETVRDKLLRGDGCLDSVIKNHLLPNVICSSVVEGRVRTINHLDRYLQLRREDNTTYVEDAQIVHKDIMTTNGVLHIIDKILIPEEALDIVEQAVKVGATEVIDLMQEAGLMKTLHTLKNFTLFLPTNEAIQAVPTDDLSVWRRDPESLAKILRYHIVPQELSKTELHSGQQLDTLGSEKQISVSKYTTRAFNTDRVTTVQCASVVRTNIGSCGGVAHLVDKVLVPPRGDVIDTLYLDPNLSVLVKMFKKAGDLVEELQRAEHVTILAPTNQAFSAVDSDKWQRIENNPEKLKKFLQGHILTSALCCSGIFRTNWVWPQRAHTLDGGTVKLTRERDVPIIQGVPIESCDLTATNGVVHMIQQLIPDVLSKYGRGRNRRPNNQRGHHGRWSNLDSWFDRDWFDEWMRWRV